MALDVFKWCVQVQNGGGVMSVTNNDREVQFGNGFRQVASSGFNTERREYQITYFGKDWQAVRKFLRDHRLKPFAFTPPSDTIGIFLLKPDTLSATPIANGQLEIKCAIVEQFTAA
ncbi:minor tail protein [Escherichia phage vB_EcoS_NBD2]|uniref:Minor tail protein n=1 Tax=Escherichia phage vB_EcoS_NBD2 TaxID=1852563 RepID=A0A192Y9K7_9CAUD|nr:minor tail protein [Escherichia phage vB_EcoS_NBD2]ANM45885.1 minor tail protein [Escherichia phage vB_EcoS_NBD2]